MKGVANVAKLDASIHRKFDQVYGLKGYPQVVLIPAGNFILKKDLKTKQSTTHTKVQEQQIPFTIGQFKKWTQTKDF